MTTIRDWLRQQLDIDQLLIFFLLAVTVSQMGYYLASFQPWGLWWVGYLQALAVDAAIWRSAWWYRRYSGSKQRRWSLVGIVVFSAVSAAYNFGFYHTRTPPMPLVQALLMGMVLPSGVALLSFLYGQKQESKYSAEKKAEKEAEKELERQRLAQLRANGICRICEAQVGADALNQDGCCGVCQRRKEGKTHRVNDWLSFQVLTRDDWTCYYCGKELSEVGEHERHLDHFIPKAHGGEDIRSNLVTACKDCNLSKSDTMPSDDEQRNFGFYLQAKAAGSDKKSQILELASNNGDLTQADIARILRTSQGYVSSVVKKANDGL